MVDFCEKYPHFQPFHGSVVILSFASFVFNPASAYKSNTDHLALLVGFIAITYLSSTFVQTNWQYTCAGQALAMILVIYYYVTKLNYEFLAFFPGMILLVFSGSFTSYHVEMKDKLEYLEKIHTQVLKRDLKKVLQKLPEGVLIYKRFGNPHVKLWNQELQKLFKSQLDFDPDQSQES